MSKKFVPYGPVLLVEPIEADNLIAGGLLVKPDSAVEKPTTGRVVAVGTDDGNVISTGLHFQIGDIVVFRQYAGVLWMFNDKEYLILETKQILGWEK